ncbi:POK19 protein, partial [Ciccaba nigrolineata]|nr:POK19 protein [Ciccaba nigrolineata]
QLQWIVQPKRRQTPIPDAITVYTDAGKKSRTAAITWQRSNNWEHKILQATEQDTLQTLELLAVVWAMTIFNEPLNIVTDSMYVAGVVERIEDAEIKEVQNKRLYELFI